MLKKTRVSGVAFLLLFVLPISFRVEAASADAREVARLNNCPPKKIEVYQQSLGRDASTIYRVDCNLPKAKSEAAQTANAILIQCDGSLCAFLRPVGADEK